MKLMKSRLGTGVAATVIVVAAVAGHPARAQSGGDLTARQLQGQTLYNRICATCHGRKGDGNGPAAKRLDPTPRDFTSGLFKFSSTTGGVQPLDGDLIRTISEGIPGTWMPAWKYHLDPDEIAAVVSYIKRFSDVFGEEMYEEDILLRSPERPSDYAATSESAAAGRLHYVTNKCAECHGERGRGDGPAAGTHEDSWGHRIMPTNLRSGVFRGGVREQDVYRALTTGLGGTPMPAYGEILSEQERWELVDYLLSLRSSKKWRSYLRSSPTWENSSQQGRSSARPKGD